MLAPAIVFSLGSDKDLGAEANVIGISCLVSAVLTTSCILFALYLTWMPLGSEIVYAQGRYFHLPMLAASGGIVLLLGSLVDKNFPGHKVVVLLLGSGAFLLNIAGLAIIINRYWIL